MKTIGELIERDLTRTIEEIIKVEQTDERSVRDEISEYVATDRLRREYRGLLRAHVFPRPANHSTAARRQDPTTHTCPATHRTPHEPQLFASTTSTR